MQKLRGYQTDCVSAVVAHINDGRRRLLYTQATGLGKTTTMAELIRLLLAEGHKILVIVHRKEIVLQIFERVREHCDLTYSEIGIEQNVERAVQCCQVVVGNVATVKSPGRLEWFHPTVIITDEAHRAAAKSYRGVYARFGVPDTCIHIGCTATAKRTDRQSLYAIHIDGSPVEITDKKGKKHFASVEESVFEQHVYERNILEGIEDGYLVPVIGHTATTETNLSDVETDADGDFKEGQLERVVNNDPRTQKTISAWIEANCTQRPTLVFCAGVAHAHDVAKAFCDAGFRAAALDGGSESDDRAHTLADFKAGRLQVLVNCGLFTEGTDIPSCSCVIHMRPTKSWNLYVQMTGRGLRVLPGIVDHLDDPLERCAAIEWSAKPDCIVLDMVDICGKHDLCALPVILDLPAKLDLQGKSLMAAKRMIDDFAEASEHLADDGKELPLTFHKLQVRLAQIDLIRSAKKVGTGWKVAEEGFRFINLPAGYQAQLIPAGDNQFQLKVIHQGNVILDKVGRPLEDFRRYLHTAAWHAENAAREHREGLQATRIAELAMPFGKHEGKPIKDLPLGYIKIALEKFGALRYPKYRSIRQAMEARL